MVHKYKLYFLIIITLILGCIIFLNLPGKTGAKPAYDIQKVEEVDDTVVYELYATVKKEDIFNYIEFELDLNDTHNLEEGKKGLNLQLVNIEPLLDFQMVKNDKNNLSFAMASNTLYTTDEEAQKFVFAKITVKKINPHENCSIAFIPGAPSQAAVNEFNIKKRAIKDSKDVEKIYEGDTFKYIIEITGNNKLKSDKLVISDTIPNELNIIDSGGATVSGQKLTWNLGEAPAGEYHKTLEITVQAKNNININQIRNVAILKVGDKEPKNAEVTVKVLKPKITITKTASKQEVNVGDEIYYNIKIQNVGTGTATNIEVSDIYDAKYLEYIRTDSQINVTKNSNSLSFIINSLDEGNSQTIRLYFKVKAGFNENTISNIAQAKYKDDTSRDEEEIKVLRPILTIEKTVSKEILKRNEIFTYNIKIRNIGDGIANNVLVTDQLNAYLEIISASVGTYQNNNFQVSYNVLGPNEEKTITLTVKVKDNAPLGNINNLATVKSDEVPNTSSDVDIKVTDSKIEITKTASKNIVKSNEEFEYTLVVKNVGDASTGRLTISDVINNNLEIIDASGASINGQTLTWIVNSLDIEASITYNIRVKVKKNTPDMVIPNIAKAQEDNKEEVESQVYVDVKNPRLELKKEVINEANNKYVMPNEEYTYKITVTNKGSMASDKITITDNIDNLLTILDASGGTVKNNTITWSIASLGVGESRSFLVKVKLNNNVVSGTKIKNIAVLTHNEEKLEDEVDVEVIDDDLYIIKEASKEKVRVNEEFSYTIKVGNQGKKEALSILVKDPIPNNLEVISYNISKGDINITNNNLEANIPSLSTNEEVIITINVRVTSGKKEDIINNVATLKYEDKTLTDEAKVIIIDTDIVISKVSSVAKTYNNYEYYYTITVTNKGEVAAKDLEVVDTFDKALTIIDASGGVIDNNTIKWTIDILNANETKTFIVKVKTTNSLNNDVVLNNVVVYENGKPDKKADAKVIVEDINFSIKKEVNKNKVFKGEEFTYTIVVKNESNVSVPNVTISDQIDPNLIVVETQAINDQGILTWTTDFAPLEEKRFTIVVTTKKDVKVNQVINAALLTYQDKYVDSNQVIVTLEDLESPQTGKYINYLVILLCLVLGIVLIKLRKNRIYKI